MKFLHLHIPSTNDSGTEAWFRDMYTGENKLFAAYRVLVAPTRYSRERLEGIFQVIHPYYRRAQYDLVPSMGTPDTLMSITFLRYGLSDRRTMLAGCRLRHKTATEGMRQLHVLRLRAVIALASSRFLPCDVVAGVKMKCMPSFLTSTSTLPD